MSVESTQFSTNANHVGTVLMNTYNSDVFDSKGVRIGKVAKIALHALTLALLVTTVAAIVIVSVLSVAWSIAVLTISSLALGVLLIAQVTPVIKPYLPEKGQKVVNFIRSVVLDLLAKALVLITYPISQTWFDPKKEHVHSDQTPILLVHGYLHNSSAWTYFRYRLKHADIKNVFTINLGNPLLSIEEYARKVEKKVKEIQELTGRCDIRLIGHSMGGVVSSYYAIHFAPKDSVKSITTLGSPLEGTKIAVIAPGKSPRQMQYMSSFIRDLKREIEQSEIPHYHIGTDVDLIVRPPSSSIIEKHKFTRFDDLGHISLLFSDRVIRHCVAELRPD